MDKESGQRLSKVLNGWTLTRCSKPYKIVMWFKRLFTAKMSDKVSTKDVQSSTPDVQSSLIGTLHYYDECSMAIAVKSMDWALAMWELDNELRNRIKYQDGHTGEVAGLEWAREALHETLETYGISLEDIK